MNRTRIIWGVVCLVIGAVLSVAYWRLPAEELMFNIGEVNVAWLPALIFSVVGFALLVSGLTSGEKEPKDVDPLLQLEDEKRSALNKQLESTAWALFLIMLGGFLLVPDDTIPGGFWSIGVGLIMLGLNGARYYYGLRMSGFTFVLGILALIGGVGEVLGFTSLNGGLLLIILGLYLILKPWFDRHHIFGKAEHA
jgi:hypothetical protein